ncbi:MAG: hypothetical protein U0Q22_17900 [Acidimicrobiales bacterium]
MTDISTPAPGSDPERLDPESALPSVRARVIAFVSILLGGALGGAIGYWFIDLQCSGSCTVGAGFAMVAGTLVLALGGAVVAVISLRALAEWTARR